MPPPLDPAALNLRDPDRGRRNRDALLAHLGADRFAKLAGPLARLLPGTADPDMALNNLERLFAAPAAREHLPALLDSRGRGLDAVLQLIAASQLFADTLATDPDALDVARTPPRRNPSTAELIAELRSAVGAAFDDAGVLRAFRRFRRLHTLRVGANDILRDRPLEEVTRDLSRVADAALEVAVRTAVRSTAKKFGEPTTPAGRPARLAALAFGKLGGDELNYSSDIDLMFVYDEDGETTGRRTGGVPNAEFYARAVAEVVRLLSSVTDRGFAYRVDLRLRPEGKRGPLARTAAGTLSYYDVMGRTWERQALIKLRHVAGDAALAREFLQAVQPFVYRKYFSFAEINEVKAMKRRMEGNAARGGADEWDVKAGRGGIRDIEYTVQFLQLLNGGDLPAVRQRNTLLALEALEIAGCLTPQETYILADAYRFLRKTEHRLQLLFDLQTHRIPAAADEQRRLARRMGYAEKTGKGGGGRGSENVPAVGEADSHSAVPLPPSALSAQRRSPLDEAARPAGTDVKDLLIDPLDQFLKDYLDKTRLDRTILDHLLHQAFADSDERAEPETDLLLAPDPDEAGVRAVLGRYGFKDVAKAYQNLSQLARESVPFLSARRCRHFLAGIAPQLLRAAADTPDPDEALNNLERVTASLGAKAVLYELFIANPPSLRLYVDLCAGSPFLSGLLTNNPGMIDDLLDSLVLDQPRPAAELNAELTELCRGATDPDPILHSFQDKEVLRIGVRDLLNKDTVRETTAALSDVADAVVNAVFDLHEPAVRRKYGVPVLSPLSASGRGLGGGVASEEPNPPAPFPKREGGEQPCRYAVVGLGKLGGREISYHSDLDLIVLFEGDGTTDPADAGDAPAEPTTNAHYFTDLTQRAINALSRAGPMGRLYAVDMRLRPTGRSGRLVLTLAEFRRYFASPDAGLWERQTLTRARVVRGDPSFAAEVEAAVRGAALAAPWRPAVADEIRAMRARLEATASPRSLKRGPGGLVDVEFLVQLLQLKHGREKPEILQPNVWAALDALRDAGLLSPEQAEALRAGYSFLRRAEARLRVVTDRPLTEVPEAADDRDKLARRLGFDGTDGRRPGEALADELARVTGRIRAVFEAVTNPGGEIRSPKPEARNKSESPNPQ